MICLYIYWKSWAKGNHIYISSGQYFGPINESYAVIFFVGRDSSSKALISSKKTKKWKIQMKINSIQYTVPSYLFFFSIASCASRTTFFSASIFRFIASFFDSRLWWYAPYKIPVVSKDQRPNWKINVAELSLTNYDEMMYAIIPIFIQPIQL